MPAGRSSEDKAGASHVALDAAGGGANYKWSLRATGRVALYLLLAAALLGCLLTAGSVPAPLVVAIVAAGILGMLSGIDLSGQQNRRMEAEIQRYVKELDRVVDERNRLQQLVLKNPQTSKNRKGNGS